MTVLPCLAAVALAAALLPGDGNGQDAVAAAIARYQEAFDRIDRARPEYEALRRSAIEEAAAGLPFATLAAADALRLAAAGLGRSPTVHDRLAARLDALRPASDAQGAERVFARLALALEGPEPAPDPAVLRPLLEEAVSHPGAPAALASTNAAAALRTLSGAVERTDEGHEVWTPALTRLVAAPRPCVPPEAAVQLASLWEALDARLPADDALREPARRALAAALRKSAGAARNQPTLRQRLSEEAARMAGAAALGRLIGAPAPALDVLWTSSPRVRRLADLRGKVVAVLFWAPWSQPSVDALPRLVELADRFRGRPFEAVAVTSPRSAWRGAAASGLPGDPAASGRSMADYLERRGLRVTVLITRQDCRNPDFAVRALPHLALLDANGRVAHNGDSPLEPAGRTASRVEALLREAEASRR